jgi:4-amino-4-deoxy-L-arabinose transferase-like glycosyltransferase
MSIRPPLEFSFDVRIARRISAHWPLAVILALFVPLALAYSLWLPLGEAPDEIYHFALIRFIVERGRPPLTQEERQAVGPKGDASPIYHALVAVLTQHVSVSALPALPDARQRTQRFIPMDNFPDVRLFHTENEAFPFHDIVLAWHLARLPSIPLGATTIVLAYATAMAIYPGRRVFATTVAGFVAFLPRFIINSAVVNDDNLVVPLIALSVYYLVRVAQGDTRRRALIIMGALMGLAAAVKYHAVVLLPEMTAVLAALAWGNGWGWRAWLRRWGWAVLAFVLASGWWFAFLIVQFNQVAQLGWVKGLAVPLGDPVLTAGVSRVLESRAAGTPYTFSWSDWVLVTFRSFWIELGVRDAVPPAVDQIRGVFWGAGLFTLAALLGLVVYGCRHRGRRTSPAAAEVNTSWQPVTAILAFHFLVYLGVVAMRYLLRQTSDTAQGRHLYPALTSISFFFVLGLDSLLASLRRVWPGRWSPLLGDKALALGVSGAMVGLSALILPLFILPLYSPYLPIVTADAVDVPISHRLGMSFAKGLDFAGYDVDTSQARVGQALPVTLYWHATAKQPRDYLIRLCLRDSAGQWVTCQQEYPLDGRYPTRAWEVGYLIKDRISLPTPACLPAGDYELILSALPLRLDVAATTVDEANEAPPLVLGHVAMTQGSLSPLANFEVWVAGERHNQGSIGLKQIRQGLTVITYDRQSDRAADVRLAPVNEDSTSGTGWSPLAFAVTYRCPNGPLVSTHNFVADLSVRPGSYRLQVGGQALSQLEVFVITRLRDFTTSVAPPIALGASFNEEVKLLGYAADLSPRRPGDTINLTAYWRGLRTMSRDHVGVAYLLDHTMAAWGQTDQTLGGSYPNILWAAGELVSEEYHLAVAPQTPPGLYTIQFGVYDYEAGVISFLPALLPDDSQPVERLYLGQVRVVDPAEGQPPSHPMAVRFGGQIELLGYDLSAERLMAGQPLRLTLYWQAAERPAADYTVFTQLIGPDGQVWGQQDNQPQAGRYPTTAWPVRDKVVDRYELKLKEGAPPGTYRLLVGMYDLTSGQRLAAIAANGAPLPDNAIPLATLTAQ